MGAGKATIGKALAHEMGVDFFDLDWYIEDRFHKKIPVIFAEQGESAFRDIERKMLNEVGEFENVVISCGGGTPCFFDNIDFMNSHGEVVYLRAKPSVLKEHLLMGKSQRPLIQGKSPDELIQYIEESLEHRKPFYEKAKHCLDIEVIHTKEEISDYVHKIMDMVKG